MTSQNIPITLSNKQPDGQSGSFWLRMEQESYAPDAPTKAQVADLTDSIYEINPCEEETLSGGEDREAIPTTNDTVEKAREVRARAAEIWSLPICGSEMDAGGEENAFDTKVRVYMSHVCAAYEVTVNKGRVISQGMDKHRVRREVEVTVVVDDNFIELELPISTGCDGNDNYSYIFECSVPYKSKGGSRVVFESVVGVVTFKYTTEYKLIDIHVPAASGGQAEQECVAFCFCQGLVVSCDIDPPPIDDDDNLTCLSVGDTGSNGLPPWDGEGEECYQKIEVERRCECTNDEYDTYSYEVSVKCPPGETGGAHQVGDTIKNVEFVNCGIVDEYGTPEFFEENCCHPGAAPVRCKKKYSKWGGGAGESSKLDSYRDRDDVTLIPVAPEDGICGVHVTEQKVTTDCCDDAPQIYWNEEDSASVMSPDSAADVFVTGGIRPLTWKIRGSGFTFFGGKRDATTSHGQITILTDSDACGTATIYVTDGCTSATGVVLSTEGKWESIAIDEYTGGALDAYDDRVGGELTGVSTLHAQNDQYRITQSFFRYNEADTGLGCQYDSCSPPENDCEDYSLACSRARSYSDLAGDARADDAEHNPGGGETPELISISSFLNLYLDWGMYAGYDVCSSDYICYQHRYKKVTMECYLAFGYYCEQKIALIAPAADENGDPMITIEKWVCGDDA